MGYGRNVNRGPGVYVITRSGGMVKVGLSRNAQRRLSGLQVATPDELALFHCERVADIAAATTAERLALDWLAPWHVSGEWFECRPELARIAVRAAVRGAPMAAFFATYSEAGRLKDAWLSAGAVERRAAKAAYRSAFASITHQFPAEIEEIEDTWWDVTKRWIEQGEPSYAVTRL